MSRCNDIQTPISRSKFYEGNIKRDISWLVVTGETGSSGDKSSDAQKTHESSAAQFDFVCKIMRHIICCESVSNMYVRGQMMSVI